MLVLIAALGTAAEQPNATAGYRAYPLKHVTAVEAQKVLTEMLAGLGDACHVVVDSQKNQLLLRGPEQAHQIARQSLESMDRAGVRPAGEKPVVKVYPCVEGRQAETIARLRKLLRKPQRRARGSGSAHRTTARTGAAVGTSRIAATHSLFATVTSRSRAREGRVC